MSCDLLLVSYLPEEKYCLLIGQNSLTGQCRSSTQIIYNLFKITISQQQIELDIILLWKADDMFFSHECGQNPGFHCNSPKMISKVKMMLENWIHLWKKFKPLFPKNLDMIFKKMPLECVQKWPKIQEHIQLNQTNISASKWGSM